MIPWYWADRFDIGLSLDTVNVRVTFELCGLSGIAMLLTFIVVESSCWRNASVAWRRPNRPSSDVLLNMKENRSKPNYMTYIYI